MHEETKIEMKLEEEMKPIKKICEKVMDIVSTEFEKGAENVDTKEMGEAIDIIKDLYEAKEKIAKGCYYKYILAAMEKEENEEQEYKKVMEKMREEYSSEDDDTERRFYDNYRYANGRFAPKGRGTRRRGYAEPLYHMPMDYDYDRDLDRMTGNRMYYSGGGSNGGNMNGSSSRGYEDGYSDGNRRGYSDGVRDGEQRGRNSRSESRYERAKRGYQESKEMHNSGSAEDKKLNMKEMEKLINIIFDEIDEALDGESPEMKSMVKAKITSRTQGMH